MKKSRHTYKRIDPITKGRYIVHAGKPKTSTEIAAAIARFKSAKGRSPKANETWIIPAP